MSTLRLLEVRRARDHVAVTCGLDDLHFHFTVWYQDLDLDALAQQHGVELLDRIAFHIAMFQINAVCSLRPDAIDLGPYAHFATARFIDLWKTVWRKVWAQWRWEHQLRDYQGPEFLQPAAMPTQAIRTAAGPIELLAFCGGGKDSLVALKLLERAGLPFATLSYAHSIYGSASHQHALLEQIAGASVRVRAERQWVFDDFMEVPVLGLRPELGVSSLLAAETPASVFAALPIALARGYRGLVVAHEASANTGNLNWGGEDVNHQWGKSWQAEVLLDEYLRSELLADVHYFSVLQPVHDEVIFELLTRDAHLVPRTHSCNLQKPWCGRCAKCSYVWLQMAAHLPPALVDATFGAALCERPENAHWFRELLGLTEHTPFECVGSAREARLALALLPRPLGPQLARIEAEVGLLDVSALARGLVGVAERHGMPPQVAAGVMPQLLAAAAAARKRLGILEHQT
jgi:UDP-N-acetyl-alpha-D-muramoyl-L-alanyl-L-glutamate epimerase